jgi:hypothetical protein
MENSEKLILLENEINELKNKLDAILNTAPINCSRAIELSKELDILIVSYYNSIK